MSEHPDPVAMMRIRTEVKPAGVTSFTTWKGLRVKRLGTSLNSDVAEVALWKDMSFKDGVLSITEDGDGITSGVPVATGTFQNVGGCLPVLLQMKMMLN